MKTVIVVIIIIICISNVPFFTGWIDFVVDQNYGYSNADGTYTFLYNERIDGIRALAKTVPIAKLDSLLKLTPVQLKPEESTFPSRNDTILYRIFWKNPLAFWRWRYYIFGNDKFDFPYKSWQEIKKQRLTNQKDVLSPYQEF